MQPSAAPIWWGRCTPGTLELGRVVSSNSSMHCLFIDPGAREADLFCVIPQCTVCTTSRLRLEDHLPVRDGPGGQGAPLGRGQGQGGHRRLRGRGQGQGRTCSWQKYFGTWKEGRSLFFGHFDYCYFRPFNEDIFLREDYFIFIFSNNCFLGLFMATRVHYSPWRLLFYHFPKILLFSGLLMGFMPLKKHFLCLIFLIFSHELVIYGTALARKTYTHAMNFHKLIPGSPPPRWFSRANRDGRTGGRKRRGNVLTYVIWSTLFTNPIDS